VKKKGMDLAFQNLFDLNDEDDLRYFTTIPKCDFQKMKDHLRMWVALIQEHDFTVSEFARFKQDVLECRAPELVAWNKPHKNFVMFDFNWDNITDAKRVYIAFMMIENTSVSLPSLKSSMWSIIDSCENV
jgi:hypothetical protein